MELINSRSKKRITNSLLCLPLNTKFYADIQLSGMDSEMVFQNKNDYCSKNQSWFKNSYEVEAAFSWLIKTGVLRREVDGQGLTSKIRLTPLGREILSLNPNLPNQKALLITRLVHFLLKKIALL